MKSRFQRRLSRSVNRKRTHRIGGEALEDRRVLAVWINEIHYDNEGADEGEFVEVAGDAGTNLNGYRIEFYSSNMNDLYDTINLTGTIDNEGGSGYGAVAFDRDGIQNGGADGLALVDPIGTVVEFLSYEGTLTPVEGSANGMTSTDIGVAETGSTPIGFSLQRDNTNPAVPGAWREPAAETPGDLNDPIAVNTNLSPWVEAGANQTADAGVPAIRSRSTGATAPSRRLARGTLP